jgi:hypothetical protein
MRHLHVRCARNGVVLEDKVVHARFSKNVGNVLEMHLEYISVYVVCEIDVDE